MERDYELQTHRAEDRHWWYRGRRQVLERVIAALRLPAGARILDAGCGSGRNMLELARRGTVSGVEVSDTSADRARLPVALERPRRGQPPSSPLQRPIAAARRRAGRLAAGAQHALQLAPAACRDAAADTRPFQSQDHRVEPRPVGAAAAAELAARAAAVAGGEPDRAWRADPGGTLAAGGLPLKGSSTGGPGPA